MRDSRNDCPELVCLTLIIYIGAACACNCGVHVYGIVHDDSAALDLVLILVL